MWFLYVLNKRFVPVNKKKMFRVTHFKQWNVQSDRLLFINHSLPILFSFLCERLLVSCYILAGKLTLHTIPTLLMPKTNNHQDEFKNQNTLTSKLWPIKKF